MYFLENEKQMVHIVKDNDETRAAFIFFENESPHLKIQKITIPKKHFYGAMLANGQLGLDRGKKFVVVLFTSSANVYFSKLIKFTKSSSESKKWTESP